ncbi:MAG TPA: hypothetical protein VJ672_12260 [Gemmatimonadaceae bacterium]|nr:hypothetical protein [Gemmatimonadaceae bacterium]
MTSAPYARWVRIALVASGATLVLCGGWALAASMRAGDPRSPHVHSVPIGLLGTGAIVLGGILLALYVVVRRPA